MLRGVGMGTAADVLTNEADEAIQALYRFMTMSDSRTFPCDDDRVAEAMLAHGWWVRSVRTAEAIRRLHVDGFDQESGPLVRTLIQHAMSLVWLANDRSEAFEAVLYRARAARDTFSAFWDARGHKSVLQLGAPPNAVRYIESFRALSEHVEEDNDFVSYTTGAYHAYAAQLAYIHPSAASAATYLDSTEEGITLLAQSTVPSTPLRESAIFALAATKAYFEFVDRNGGEEIIRGLEHRLSV